MRIAARLVALTLIVLGLIAALASWKFGIRPGYAVAFARAHLVCGTFKHCRYIHDQAGFVPPDDVPRFEWYMYNIQRESGVDLRFAFVDGTGGQALEDLATELVHKDRIGGGTGEERGLLLLYDVKARRMKVEVGYGLEGIFPDVFINHLVRRHAQVFFDSGTSSSIGLRLMLRLLQHRIREAILGEQFDTRVLSFIDKGRYLSGGGGVTAAMGDAFAWKAARLPDEELARYRAGDSPQATYATYLSWLAQPVRDGRADFLTPNSRGYVSGLPLSPAYADFILMGEYGKSFEILERGDIAVLYFTGTPLVAPHFFSREAGKWRMDIVAEVQNTRELVGTGYNWAYIGVNDRYTKAVDRELGSIKVPGMRRFFKGDNRLLPISNPKG